MNGGEEEQISIIGGKKFGVQIFSSPRNVKLGGGGGVFIIWCNKGMRVDKSNDKHRAGSLQQGSVDAM
jgi:hypothetical protein